MNTFVHRMEELERELAAARGPLTFFGLLEREDSGGKWDVVVSAPWIKRGHRTAAIYEIANRLTPAEMMEIAHVVPLPPSEEWVRSLDIEPVTDAAPVELLGREFKGIETRRAWILTYNPALVAHDAGHRKRVRAQRGTARRTPRRTPAGA